MALGLILVPLAVEIQRAALAVGKLAAHLLVTHRTLWEVFYILQETKRVRIKKKDKIEVK